MVVIDFNEFRKESVVKSKIYKHKEVCMIALLVGISLISLSTIQIEISAKSFDEDAMIQYMMTISDRYNSSYFMHDNLEITDAEYLSELLQVKADYEKYLNALENHQWQDANTFDIIYSFEFELKKINQEILSLQNS